MVRDSGSTWLRALGANWIGFAAIYLLTGFVRFAVADDPRAAVGAVAWMTSGASLAFLSAMVVGIALLALDMLRARGPISLLGSALLGGGTALVEVARGARWDLAPESAVLLLILGVGGAALLHAIAPPAARGRRAGKRVASIVDGGVLVLISFTVAMALVIVVVAPGADQDEAIHMSLRVLHMPVLLVEIALLGLGAALFWGCGAWLAARLRGGLRAPSWYCKLSGLLAAAGLLVLTFQGAFDEGPLGRGMFGEGVLFAAPAFLAGLGVALLPAEHPRRAE